LYEGGCSADGYKPIAGHVVPNRVSERNSFSIGNGSGVDATTPELVKERLVVIDSHTGPSMITNQTVEDVN
jgi:hypothetical protein